jgi:hypothetical protein
MNRLRNSNKNRTPFAGCAFLAAAVLVVVLLIAFCAFSLFRQFNEIVKFTAAHPVPVEVSSLENQEAALVRLAQRLEAFRQCLTDREAATLDLTAEEINLVIAAYEPMRELRGTLRVVRIEDGLLHMAIAFPLNGKPRLARQGEAGWISSTPRYLNGRLVARPALLKGELVLQVVSLEVPGAQVPRAFIDQMSPYRISERYLSDPVIGPAMARIRQVAVADGKLSMGN